MAQNRVFIHTDAIEEIIVQPLISEKYTNHQNKYRISLYQICKN